ncbi:MAG: hypothetical protein JNL05_00595 [Flavobacteriales bacterium]|nr:hypothetical protein [Flavobacteriales bacterium]
MANCTLEFNQFNKAIRLSDDRRNSLRQSRNAIQATIERQFTTNGITILPTFRSQGSFVMDTIVNPVGENEFDLDLGVYFIGDENRDERATPHAYHAAILEAVKDQTHEVFDKDTCVRVRYVRQYHVDLPIYYRSYSHPDLAHKKDGWTESNPLEFIEWFESHTRSGFRMDYLIQEALRPDYERWKEDMRKTDDQLRRLVRYVKAWADEQGKDDMPAGVCLTILVVNNFVRDGNDDAAFLRTMQRMFSTLNQRFECHRPTTPQGEDLFANYSDAQRQYFMGRLRALVFDGERAFNATMNHEACALWRKHLGVRFPCTEPPRLKEEAKPLVKVIGSQAKPYRW